MSKTDDLLREFLSAPKPAWMIPIDVIVMAQLIIIGKDEYPGHEAIGVGGGQSRPEAQMPFPDTRLG